MDEQEDLPKDMLEQVSCRVTLRAQVMPDSAGKEYYGDLVVVSTQFPHLSVEEVRPRFHLALLGGSRTCSSPCSSK